MRGILIGVATGVFTTAHMSDGESHSKYTLGANGCMKQEMRNAQLVVGPRFSPSHCKISGSSAEKRPQSQALQSHC